MPIDDYDKALIVQPYKDIINTQAKNIMRMSSQISELNHMMEQAGNDYQDEYEKRVALEKKARLLQGFINRLEVRTKELEAQKPDCESCLQICDNCEETHSLERLLEQEQRLRQQTADALDVARKNHKATLQRLEMITEERNQAVDRMVVAENKLENLSIQLKELVDGVQNG